ncbi:MAG TPA: hypothetical protein VFY50_02470 [Candidatus Nitrosocosmicus sp.]|nr:hypothetical protein [Candidatus Nitrosocosmicus sp.]
MKSNNRMVLLSIIMGMVVGLICGPISIHLILAAPPHPCFGGAQDYTCICENNPSKLTATCCWNDSITGAFDCQTCEVNTDTGDFEACTSKGKSDSSVVAPPPSGKAPPASTEKCPDNSAVDQNGNCTPITQLPDDTSDNTKPNLRGNVLDDLMSSQSQDSVTSEKEQEEDNNQANG